MFTSFETLFSNVKKFREFKIVSGFKKSSQNGQNIHNFEQCSQIQKEKFMILKKCRFKIVNEYVNK